MNSPVMESDFLVIGSGIAGLTFAIKASELGTVNIVTKKKEFESNTNYAQGGIASVVSPDDTFDDHIRDTLKSGAGLCNSESVEILVTSGPERIKELMEWGVQFTGSGGNLDLGREGGHSCNRIVHAQDLTGAEVEKSLLARISSIKSISLFEDHTAVDLLTGHQLGVESNGEVRCYGAYILNNTSGSVDTFTARTTFIASGGTGQVYLHTTNPDIATGDGIAMAYRAGALIADMEFIQFHPTSLYTKDRGARSFLISEAVRGEGAVILNSSGRRIMKDVHPLEDLAPRDIVARAIDYELKKTGCECVYLDISFKKRDFLKQRFPNIYSRCMGEGIDMAEEPIPVVPAAHYLCGGIVTDTWARSSIENLFVSGESACTGVHGANRLASNSLLEALVFSDRAVQYLSKDISRIRNIEIPNYPAWDKEGTFDLEEWILVQHNIEDVKRLMWDYVGIVRSDIRIITAYRRILMLAEEIYTYYRKSTLTSGIIELRNLATVAKLIIKSAMTREDSVGLHYNTDHTETDSKLQHIVLHSQHDPALKSI